MSKFLKLFLFFLLTFLFISTFFLIKIYWQENQPRFLKIIFLNVGQGDSVFIETPSGFKTIIDAGVNSTVVRSVSKFLPFYDRKIDLLIATHSDSDHVGGFVDLIQRFKIKNFSQNSIKDNDALNAEINNLIDQNKIDQYFLKSGDKIILDEKENIYLEILWPPDDHQEKDNNDNSLIIRIVYQDVAVMLTGDASLEIEEKLIQNLSSDKLKSNILKAGHHGSKTSTNYEFLGVVNPDFVLITAGKDNRFGHPHQEVLDNIEKFSDRRIIAEGSDEELPQKIKILETFVLGSIYFQSDGEEVWVVD